MHPNRRDELSLFKSHINLTEYAASAGYVLDRAHSSRNSVAMRGPHDEKIIIARDARQGRDPHWIYFSVADPTDHGTIIDFVTHRTQATLGQLRKTLRPWVGLAGTPPTRPPLHTYRATANIEPIPKDLATILVQFAAMTPILHRHAYLEDVRRIPAAVLGDPRFADRLYTDRFQNAVFPHHDRHGVCGMELRNHHFKGFSKGGSKGLWYSTITPTDTTLILTESAIDALSYHALHQPADARYFSIAGELSPGQRDLLATALGKLPQGATVLIATDHDPGGTKLAEQLRTLVEEAPRDDLGVLVHQPEPPGDWNDVLTGAPHAARSGTAMPSRRAVPPPHRERALRPRHLARPTP